MKTAWEHWSVRARTRNIRARTRNVRDVPRNPWRRPGCIGVFMLALVMFVLALALVKRTTSPHATGQQTTDEQGGFLYGKLKIIRELWESLQLQLLRPTLLGSRRVPGGAPPIGQDAAGIR